MDFSDTIVEIVKQSYEDLHTDKLILNHKENMNPDWFQNQFGTVQIRLPRRSGHSLAALKLLRIFPNSKILIPREQMRHQVIKQGMDQVFDEHCFTSLDKKILAPHQLRKFFKEQQVILDLFIIDTYQFIEEEIKTHYRIDVQFAELADVSFHSKMLVKLG